MTLHADTPEQAKAAYLAACSAAGAEPERGKAALRWGGEGPIRIAYKDGLRTLWIGDHAAKEPRR